MGLVSFARGIPGPDLLPVDGHAQRGGFPGPIAELHEVLTSIIQTSFGLKRTACRQKGLPELTIRDGETFFITHQPVLLQCVRKIYNGLIEAPGRRVL